MREISPTISVLREIKNYQLIPSECLGYAQVQIQIDSFARLGKLLGKETECFVLDQKMTMCYIPFKVIAKNQK